MGKVTLRDANGNVSRPPQGPSEGRRSGSCPLPPAAAGGPCGSGLWQRRPGSGRRAPVASEQVCATAAGGEQRWEPLAQNLAGGGIGGSKMMGVWVLVPGGKGLTLISGAQTELPLFSPKRVPSPSPEMAPKRLKL